MPIKMAAGGSKTFSRSIDAGSEELLDFICSRCNDTKQGTGTLFHCPSCDLYYCSQCLAIHDEFFGPGGHGVVEASERGTQGTMDDVEECPEHAGQKLTMFCKKHQALCCSICVSVDHRLCEQMTFLPKVAKGILKSKELNSVKDDLESVIASLQQLKIAKEEKKRALDQSRDDFQNTMKKLRRKIRLTFDKLQEEASKEMDTFYDEETGAIAEAVSHCDCVIDELEREKSQLKENVEKESVVFIRMKTLQNRISKYHKTVKSISQADLNENVSFTVDPGLLNYLENIDSLGTFGASQSEPTQSLADARKTRKKAGTLKKQVTPRQRGKIVEKVEQFDVRMENDDECCIQGICQLPNENILLSDYNNFKLKKLDASYKIVAYCKLPSEPSGVCCTGQGEVAVALENCSIQFVSVARRLKKTRSIKTSHGCYGLAHHKGKLYVTECAGTKVYVHDISGTLLQTIQSDMSGDALFSCTHHLCVSNDEEYLYVVDRDRGIVSLNLNWLFQISHPELTDPRSVCIDMDGNIFVCGNLSHNVMHLSKGALSVVISQSDGIRAPEYVCFDNTRSSLIVSSAESGECDVLNVFEIK